MEFTVTRNDLFESWLVLFGDQESNHDTIKDTLNKSDINFVFTDLGSCAHYVYDEDREFTLDELNSVLESFGFVNVPAVVENNKDSKKATRL